MFFIKAFSVSLFVLSASLGWAKSESMVLNPEQSKILWEGKKVTGKHNGDLKISEGKIMLEKGELKGGEVTIDMNSLACEDLKDKESNDKLVNHLKSDDFFSVSKFPHSQFSLSKVKKNKSKKNAYDVEGDLTIKGIAQEIIIPLVVKKKGKIYEIKGETLLDRTRWDIRFKSGKYFPDLGDKLIYDEFKVQFHLQTKER